MSVPVSRVVSNIRVVQTPFVWEVHKFGGTSVKDATCIQRVATILTDPALRSKHYPSHEDSGQHAAKVAVVVSAMSGVTDALIRAVRAAAARDSTYVTADVCLPWRFLAYLGTLYC